MENLAEPSMAVQYKQGLGGERIPSGKHVGQASSKEMDRDLNGVGRKEDIREGETLQESC